MGKSEGKEPLGRPKFRWEDNTYIFKRILKTWDGNKNKIYLAKDIDRWRAFVNAVMNFLVL
jgi:hypothetical protein